MKVKEFSDEKLIGNLDIMLNEVEDRIIKKMDDMNSSGINDDDLYFLSDMLRLTRSYNNLLKELLIVGTGEKEHS